MSDNVQKKEEALIKKRLRELSKNAYNRGIPYYSDFLSLSSQSIFHEINDFESIAFLSGGYDLSERKIAIFLPYEGYSYTSPIDCIRISILDARFAEALTHRDYLGSILNLGIDRSKLGDLVIEDKCAYLFCVGTMTNFIVENLTKVKHTLVNATRYDKALEDITLNFVSIKGFVSSVRLDSVSACAFNISRSKIISYIESGEVFVNGRVVTTNSYNLKEGDIISVRHVGKAIYRGSSNLSRKGKLNISIDRYN